jgi:hypothetical protein
VQPRLWRLPGSSRPPCSERPAAPPFGPMARARGVPKMWYYTHLHFRRLDPASRKKPCGACLLRPAASLLAEVVLRGTIHCHEMNGFSVDSRLRRFANTPSRGRKDEACCRESFRERKCGTRRIDGAYDMWLKCRISHLENIVLVIARVRKVNLSLCEATRASRGAASARAAWRA